jgi:hypothetical protein
MIEYEKFNEVHVPMISSEQKDNFEEITNHNLELLNVVILFNNVEDLNKLDKQVELITIEDNKTENNKTENNKIQLNSDKTILSTIANFFKF